jgi:hypothetical protein
MLFAFNPLMIMKLSLLIFLGWMLALTTQAQETESAVSTSRSLRQKINTKSLYTNEAVAAPQITFLMGDDGLITVSADQVVVKACIKTAQPLTRLELYVNDVLQQANRDLKVEADPQMTTCDQAVSQTVQLREGRNKLRLIAYNAGGQTIEPFLIDYKRKAIVATEKRLALIIGNSAYPSTSRLANPANDARDMASTLKDLGFEVMLYTNLDKKGMRKAVDDFGFRLKDYQVGLFFYAGHGVALADRNYLVPVDAAPQAAGDIEFDCEPADRILAKMEEARTTTNIVVLDACRNNPFERSLVRGGNDGGLATMKSLSGSYIAYATAPGSTAADGTGRNGLYTSALLKNLKNPGLPIEEVFKQVRVEVQQQTSNRQRPWDSSSLTNSFYFRQN